jgi:hypothetical protein
MVAGLPWIIPFIYAAEKQNQIGTHSVDMKHILCPKDGVLKDTEISFIITRRFCFDLRL